MERAIGLAVHLAIMPSFRNAYEGGTVRNVYAGVGAANGLLAFKLAEAGFTPERDALGSIYGGILSHWLDPARITEDLGERFEINLGFIKAYPMCRFGHPAIEAAEALIAQNPIEPDDIESVEVRTFDWAATLDDPAPKTDLAAKFSVPWAVASVLVRHSANADDFRTRALSDVRVLAIADRIKVREDALYSSMTPEKRPARVTVYLKNGNMFTKEVDGSGGGPDAPLSRSRVEEKFRSLANPVIGKDRAGAVVRRIAELQALPDIRMMTKLLKPENRQQSRER
jgi:2-methylcitrate dehydratase PrpD